jgi:hypothetical protein
VHMGQTYPALKPYFKGVHATTWSHGEMGRDECCPSDPASGNEDGTKKRKAGSAQEPSRAT